MRLNKEEYRQAVGCLKRFNYNCLKIMNIQSDILSLSISPVDGMPKAPFNIGDTTLNKVIELDENTELKKCIREYKIVVQALALVKEESKQIFEKEFRESKTRWEVMDLLNISERTYERRKRELVYVVHKEIKKWRKFGGILLKNLVIIVSVKKHLVFFIRLAPKYITLP